jgi:AraC family transcriptional regulator, transcriptional activator of pobA
MLKSQEDVLLRDYKRAFKTYYKARKIVDVDEKLSQQLTYSVMRLEDALSVLEFRAPPHRVSDYRLLYIKNGGGKARIGAEELELNDKTLLLVAAGIVTSAEFGKTITGFHLAFNLDFLWNPVFPSYHLLKLKLFDATLVPYSHLDNGDAAQFERIFEIIIEENNHHRKNKEELIALKVLQLIVLTDRFLKSNDTWANSTISPLIQQYLTLAQEHFKEHHSVAYYAKQLHTHPNSLNAVTKRITGKSAKAVIDGILISEAKYMLYHTSVSIKEIAYDLGFTSPSHFIRFFKRIANESPAAYRSHLFEIGSN